MRYALRFAADDGCFIPIGGYQRWRWYWGALLAAAKANRGRPERDTGRNTGPSVISAAESHSRTRATGRTCRPVGIAFSTPLPS